MTEPETAETGLAVAGELLGKPKRRKRRNPATPTSGDAGKREAGTWIAKTADHLSAHTSKLAALRCACPPGSVAFLGFGDLIPERGQDHEGGPPDSHGFWVGRRAGDGCWAGFEREVGAREFACPENGVQFVRNGETIRL